MSKLLQPLVLLFRRSLVRAGLSTPLTLRKTLRVSCAGSVLRLKMKIWTSEHIFRHPWETVATAAWRKYPNPHNSSVRGIDVLDRHVEPSGVLRTHRLLITQWNLPTWVTKMVGMDQSCFGSEHSVVDPQKKVFELKTKNLTLCNYLCIDETLTYQPHPENSNHTLLKQEAVITVKGIPLSNYLEGVVEASINSNAHKGRQAMEWVIGNIKAEVSDLTKAAQRGMDSMQELLSSPSRVGAENTL